MSFVPNSFQQISLFDQLAFLPKRKRQMLDKSWARPFSDHIFTRINELIFAPLYSEKTNSRPNAPINVLVGALILKDFTGLTDEELTEACEFDFRYQYALHTTGFVNQPVSERTLSRFRSRLAAYELTTGEDLLHQCFIEMADGLRKYMEITPNIKRMDSMMVESNIRHMGRLELLYTCLSNLVKELHREGRLDLLAGLEHYADSNDRNRVIYYEQDVPTADRLQKIIDDAAGLLPKCENDFSESEDYQLLVRAIEEQTKQDDDGHLIPKGKGEGLHSGILQNPADPDATYRQKANKPHRGYAANLTGAVDENGSIVTDYQYDVNTRSDVDFIKEAIENAGPSEETVALITDGAYGGDGICAMASGKNISLITTGLRGRKPREILTQFQLTEDGHGVIACPNGHTPKTSSYVKQTNSVRASFSRCCCENCPHRKECNAKIKKRTALVLISLGTLEHTKEAIRRRDDERMALIGRIRNGVETLPSILRRKYHVDQMPVRGKLKTKVFFGFKVFALNFTKLWLHERGLERCRTFTV